MAPAAADDTPTRPGGSSGGGSTSAAVAPVTAAGTHQLDDGLGPLPPGWELRWTADNRPFFVDHSTQVRGGLRTVCGPLPMGKRRWLIDLFDKSRSVISPPTVPADMFVADMFVYRFAHRCPLPLDRRRRPGTTRARGPPVVSTRRAPSTRATLTASSSSSARTTAPTTARSSSRVR